MSDLPKYFFRAKQYPVTVEFLAGNEVVHTIHVEKPDGLALLHIPGLSKIYGPVGVRITFGDGEVLWTPPPQKPS